MSITFPRYSQNGTVDDGSRLHNDARQVCPNCGSENYFQTISTENCSDCGLQCDYWGGGANDVYKEMMDRDARRKAELDQAESMEAEKRLREGNLPIWY